MIKVKIITPLGLYKEGEVEAVHLRTVEGDITILPNHIPLVAMLETCKCSLKEKGDYHDYAMAGGMMQFKDNEMRILTDAIEGREEIDIERAKRAKERAEARLATVPISNVQKLHLRKQSTVLKYTEDKKIRQDMIDILPFSYAFMIY